MPFMQSPPGAVTRIDGRECLYFAGTGYLGLQGRAEVIEAACDAVRQFGTGSANSRTAFGTTPPVFEVERRVAELFGTDDAFYYASGWMGNGILLASLDLEQALILIDECSHYSLFEAARATARPPIVFHHRDVDDLRTKLKEHVRPGQYPIVLSDGVFAATGRIAPVDRYSAILRDYAGAVLCIDDAHGLAVLGDNGRGTFEHCRISGRWPVAGGQWPVVSGRCMDSPLPQAGEGSGVRAVGSGQQSAMGHGTLPSSPNPQSPIPNPSPPPCPALLCCGTLSKAVGGYGGIIPGDAEFIRRLKNSSAYYGGASPPPPPIAAASARAIEIILNEPELRARLRTNALRLKTGLRQLGFDVDDAPTPIAAVTIGGAENMQRIQRELMVQDIAIAYMAKYAGLGPEGALRIAVFATHTEGMIQRLLESLRQLL